MKEKEKERDGEGEKREKKSQIKKSNHLSKYMSNCPYLSPLNFIFQSLYEEY